MVDRKTLEAELDATLGEIGYRGDYKATAEQEALKHRLYRRFLEIGAIRWISNNAIVFTSPLLPDRLLLMRNPTEERIQKRFDEIYQEETGQREAEPEMEIIDTRIAAWLVSAKKLRLFIEN